METEQKEKLKAAVGKAADALSDKALEKAKKQESRLWRIMLWLVGVLLAGIAALAGVSGCSHVPEVTLTVEQLQLVEEVYTAAGGEVRYRVVPVVEEVKK